MMKQYGSACDHGRHSRQTADEKIYRNFPCPDRRLDNRLTVIAGFPRNRTARDINAATGNHTIGPGLLAQVFEPLFRLRLVRHLQITSRSAVAASLCGAQVRIAKLTRVASPIGRRLQLRWTLT